MNFNNLLSFYLENQQPKKYQIELLKNELDAHIYFYGSHFRFPKETEQDKIADAKQRIKSLIDNLTVNYRYKKISHFNQKGILSNSYFSLDADLTEIGYKTLSPIHSLKTKSESIFTNNQIRKFFAINNRISKSTFQELLHDDLMIELNEFKQMLYDVYKSFDLSALIVPNDVALFEKINLELFQSLKRPSFIFLHGLPARYNNIDDNQSDYLIVWGEKIKENYIKYGGFNSDKILVSGHPFYKNILNINLRNDFSRILVLTKVQTGTQHSDKTRIQDRANSIYYLIMVEKTLKELGVKNVFLRVHPSENINWYYKFIDQKFFITDNLPLNNSLRKASLVIGPTSTVFLEALFHGVNYIVFEPLSNGLDLYSYSPVAPFDKSDDRVEIANSQSDLKVILKSKYIVNRKILNDYYSTPFNLSFIHKILK